MRYRTRRAAWQLWAWFWGGLLAAGWPAALPLGGTGKAVAVAAWWCVALPLAVAVLGRKRRRR